MRILNSDQVYFQPTDLRFGPSKIKAVINFIVVTAFFAILITIPFKKSEWVPVAFILVLFGIFFTFSVYFIIIAFKKDGWKIAIQNSAILLKTDTAAKDKQSIIEIGFNEITSVRKLQEQYFIYRKGKGSYRLRRTRKDVLDFELTADTLTQLKSQVDGNITDLVLPDANHLIYLTWKYMLSINKIISQLQTYCRVEAVQRIEYEKPEMKDQQKVDEYIIFLAKRGYKMDAQQFARKAFSMGLIESKDYVSRLMQ